MVFIPTYLYIKQHTVTGKLYLGKCTKNLETMLSYKGSGVRWKRHIKKHDRSRVVTLWYQLYDNMFDLVADAFSMSNAFNIVESNSWMNLRVENGLDGNLAGISLGPNQKKGRPGELNGMYGKTHTKESMESLGRERSKRTRADNIKSYSRIKSNEEADAASKRMYIKCCRISDRKEMTIANFFKSLKPQHKIYVSRIFDRRVLLVANYQQWLNKQD